MDKEKLRENFNAGYRNSGLPLWEYCLNREQRIISITIDRCAHRACDLVHHSDFPKEKQKQGEYLAKKIRNLIQ